MRGVEGLESRLLFSYPGDANSDGKVDSKDFTVLAQHYGQSSDALKFSDGDFNLDHRVNALDFSALAAHWGRISMISEAQHTNVSVFGASASARSVSFSSATVAGNTIAVLITARKGSSAATSFTVTDNKGNSYRHKQVVSGLNITTAIFYANDISGAGASHQITVTPDASAALSISLLELHSNNGHIQTDDEQTAAVENIAGVLNSPLGVTNAPDYLLELCTHADASAIVMTQYDPTFTDLAKSETSGASSPFYAFYLANNSDPDIQGAALFDDGNTSTVLAMVGLSFTDNAPAITGSSVTYAGPAPDYMLDMREYTGWLGERDPNLTEHFGHTGATSSSAIIAQVNGVLSMDVSSAADSGIATGYTHALGAIALLANITPRTAGAILGANDAGGGANGAFKLSSNFSGNLVGQIVTDSSSATCTSAKGEAMGDVGVVYWLINDGTHLTVEVNGFEVTRLTISGAPLTVANGLRIFNSWASGGYGAASTAKFYALRCYNSVPTDRQRRVIESDLASILFGNPITKRYRIVTHGAAAGNIVAAESDDGVAFVNARRISFSGTIDGIARDFNYAGHDSTNQCFYWVYTANNFTTIGSTFGRCKSRGDFRLLCPDILIDGRVTGEIDGVTSSPWSPMVVPTNSTPQYLTWQKSNTAVVFAASVSNWNSSSPTLGTPTQIAGNVGDQPTILRPGDVGNPTGLFRAFMGVGYIQTCSTIDGTYGSLIQLSGAQAGEGGWVLARDNDVLFINPSDTGWVYWASTDNGSTWGAKQSITGLDSLGFGQGSIIDGLAVGVWARPTISRRAFDRLSNRALRL
jgi:hypothetical protein